MKFSLSHPVFGCQQHPERKIRDNFAIYLLSRSMESGRRLKSGTHFCLPVCYKNVKFILAFNKFVIFGDG